MKARNQNFYDATRYRHES